MQNHKVIKDNIIAGDILLSRKINSPVTVIIDGIIESSWEWSFLYLGNNKIMSESNIKSLDTYLNNNFNVGLFRIKNELDPKEVLKLIKGSRKIFGMNYIWFKRLYFYIKSLFSKKKKDLDLLLKIKPKISSSDGINISYKKINRSIKNKTNLNPIDLDNSKNIIRIA